MHLLRPHKEVTTAAHTAYLPNRSQEVQQNLSHTCLRCDKQQLSVELYDAGSAIDPHEDFMHVVSAMPRPGFHTSRECKAEPHRHRVSCPLEESLAPAAGRKPGLSELAAVSLRPDPAGSPAWPQPPLHPADDARWRRACFGRHQHCRCRRPAGTCRPCDAVPENQLAMCPFGRPHSDMSSVVCHR